MSGRTDGRPDCRRTRAPDRSEPARPLRFGAAPVRPGGGGHGSIRRGRSPRPGGLLADADPGAAAPRSRGIKREIRPYRTHRANSSPNERLVIDALAAAPAVAPGG